MPLDLFSKTKIPDMLPDEMQEVVDEIKNFSNKKDCLKKVYEILIVKYRGYRMKTYLKLFDIFERDINILWNKNGFLHCNNINYVMRTLLVKSNFFKEKDIRLKWTQVWYISPHQYIQVKIDDKWVNVDIWSKIYGIEFGDYAHGFN